MKVPHGNPPLPPSTDGPPKAARAAADARPTDVSPASSARVQLARLNLANRETALARVAEIINQQSSGASRLLLDIRGQNLTVNAAIGETSLETGDWIKVMRAGNELRLLGKLAPAAESTVARALAQRLPWQQSVDSGLARVLSALTAGLKADPGTTARIPAPPMAGSAQSLPGGVRQAIEQLAGLLPSRQSLATLTSADAGGTQNLTPLGTPSATLAKPPGAMAASQIKQWIEQSGLFAESRTARASESPPADLKLALGRVVHLLLEQQGQTLTGFNRLTPIPSPDLVQAPLQFPTMTQAPQFSAEPATVGQMLRLLAGVLNRITVNQLHSQVLSTRATADAPAPNNTMVMDLPWLNQNNEPRAMQLRIEEQATESEENRKTRSRNTEWKLSLAMDLDEAGRMHFDVSLGFGTVSAQVWAEKQSTLQQAKEHLPELRKSLTEIGLDVTDLECRRGTPQGATTHLEHRLVDTRV